MLSSCSGRCATRKTPTTRAESNFRFRCYRNPILGSYTLHMICNTCQHAVEADQPALIAAG